MNILAHGYLSNRQTGLLIGNFMGDFIKGNPTHPRHNLSQEVIAGIYLHRAIDRFTDEHPEVMAVRTLLRPRCHKYAGVAVDVFFDHFLAVHFLELTGEPLADFTRFFYQTLQQNAAQFPLPAQRMLDGMMRYDWLMSYATIDGIDRSLKGISRRTAFPSGLDTATVDLKEYYEPISREFRRFWPQLVDYCERMRAEKPEIRTT